MRLLKRSSPREFQKPVVPSLSRETLDIAAMILDEVRTGGEASLRVWAERLGDCAPDGALFVSQHELKAAFDGLPVVDQDLLERVASRIRHFAEAQRASLQPLDLAISGGRAGHTLAPVERAGCYAPGGRFPLPSSVLMTAITAKAAGVPSVWVASPKPSQMTLAAAWVAGADGFLAAGGAQAIAALAYGAGALSPCDVIVGPGNRYVTAAKKLVSGEVSIDMLAGPSELVVFADETASADVVAADLLAQAEHDPDAIPILVSTSEALIDAVEQALVTQLETLPTAETARAALVNGAGIWVSSLEEGIAYCDVLAPEHLELLLANATELAPHFSHYGALFIGENAAEVLGDYGAGPNHVLPTNRTARQRGGLSVFQFLRVRTWMHIDSPEEAQPLVEDSIRLARHEGLEAHARSAAQRLRR